MALVVEVGTLGLYIQDPMNNNDRVQTVATQENSFQGLEEGEPLMSELGNLMSQYATPETMTVLAAVVVLFIGWKLTSGTIGVIGSFAKKASFAGLASTILLASGLGTMGLGIGEIGGRTSSGKVENGVPHVGFSNEELIDLAKAEGVRTDVLNTIIEYARTRDGHVPALSESDVLKLIAEQDDPATIQAIVKLYEGRRTRIDEQYAKLTAKPEPKESKSVQGKQVYDLAAFEQKKSGETNNTDPFDVVALEAGTEESTDSLMSLPMAWLCVLLGLGMTASGGAVFATRNARRNPDDPHHNSQQSAPQFNRMV